MSQTLVCVIRCSGWNLGRKSFESDHICSSCKIMRSAWSNSRKRHLFWPQFVILLNIWWTFLFPKKYLLAAVGEDASPSVDVMMGLVSVMVRVTGRTALWWGEGAKTGVKWPGTFPTTWPLLLGYKTKSEECLVKHTHWLFGTYTCILGFSRMPITVVPVCWNAFLTKMWTPRWYFQQVHYLFSDSACLNSITLWWACFLSGCSMHQIV